MLSWATEKLDLLYDQAKIAYAKGLDKFHYGDNGYRYMEPEDLVKKAKDMRCDGVAFTFNEPTIWIEYVHDVAKLAKQAGLYTVYVTNSWLTFNHIDIIGPYIDAMALDIKSLDNKYYSELCDARAAVKGVLESCLYAASRHGIHIETRTCIVPGMNDDPDMLFSIAKWIKDNLGEESVWHLLRFFPKNQLTQIPITPVKTFEIAKELGKKAGLRYINVVDDKGCD